MIAYVDTSALMAVLNADDRRHAAAALTLRTLILEGHRLICNNYVLVETTALLQHRFGIQALRVFHTDLLPAVELRWVDAPLHQRAVSALMAANRRDVSLVDFSSFEMMRDLGMTHAFALDPHFSEYGFVTLPDF